MGDNRPETNMDENTKETNDYLANPDAKECPKHADLTENCFQRAVIKPAWNQAELETSDPVFASLFVSLIPRCAFASSIEFNFFRLRRSTLLIFFERYIFKPPQSFCAMQVERIKENRLV